jgi:hypothetical protein
MNLNSNHPTISAAGRMGVFCYNSLISAAAVIYSSIPPNTPIILMQYALYTYLKSIPKAAADENKIS